VLWLGPAVLLAIALLALVLVIRKRARLADDQFEPEPMLDDGLDAVAGCLLSQPVRLGRPAVPLAERREWRPGGGGLSAQIDFDI